MTQLEFGDLVNKQLSRIELFPFFLLETQYNSKNKQIHYTCYYYPDESIEKLELFKTHFRTRGYKTTSELLLVLTLDIDNFLAGKVEEITID